MVKINHKNILFLEMELEVLMVKILMLVFWLVMLCGRADIYQHLGGKYCLHLQD
jgi:hypothetical protein